MDFHALPRRDLQALSKRNGIRANMTNGAMADALAALPAVDGIEDYVQQPVAEAPSAEPEVQAAEEEDEKEPSAAEEEKETQEVVVLDDSEEEEKDLTRDEDEEKAPSLGAGQRRATRRGRVEPVAAPATRKRAAVRKPADTAEAVAEAVPARAARGRSQRTVESAAEDEAPKTRRTARTAAGKKAGTQQEEEEKAAHGDVSDMEADTAAPVEVQSQEDEGETEEGDAAVEAVPARATRGRSQKTAVPVAQDEAPKARRTTRRAVASKTSTKQEEEEKATEGAVSDVEVAVPAPVSANEEADDSEEMEEAVDAQNEEQNAPIEEQSQEDEGETEKGDAAEEAALARATRARRQRTVSFVLEDAMPALATRARRQRTVVPVAEEEEPKGRRTSRRAAARKTTSEQEEEENTTQDSVSGVEEAVPGKMEASMDAQNEEKFAAAESETGDMHDAVPARATRARRQRTVVSVAEDEAPKARRTSRRTVTIQEDEEQQQDIVSDVETAVPAPASSDEEGDGAEEIEASMDAQNEEQNLPLEEKSQENEGVVADETPLVVEEPAAAEDCPVYSSVEEQTDTVSSEEIQHSSEDTEMVPVDEVPEPALKSVEATEEVDFRSDDDASEETEEVEEVREPALKSVEAVEEVDFTSDDDASEETEGCTVEEEPPVAEHVDSSVQEPVVDVQQCEATEEIHAGSDDTEMVPQDTQTSVEATEEVNFTSDDDASEETEDCTVEESPVAEDVESSVQEQLVDVQQCEAAEEIHAGSDDTEMLVPVKEVTLTSVEATEEADFTSHVGHASEENEDCTVEEETPVEEEAGEATEEVDFTSHVAHASEEDEVPEVLQRADKASDEQEQMAVDEVTNMASHTSEENEDCTAEDKTPAAEVDSSVQERLVDVQQCEATEEIHLASEDTEVVPVNDLPEATLTSGDAAEEVGLTSDNDEKENEAPTFGEVLQSAAKAIKETEEVGFTCDNAEKENEAPTFDELLQSAAKAVKETEEVGFTIHNAENENETPTFDEVLQSAAKAVKETEEVGFTSDNAEKENEAPSFDEVLQSAANLVKETEDMAAEEVPHNTDEYVEEEAVLANVEMPVLQSAAKAVKETEDMATDEMPQGSEAMDEGVVELVAVDNLSQATMDENVEEEVEVVNVDNLSEAMVTDDEGSIKQSGSTTDLADVSVGEEAVVAADETPSRSVAMDMSADECFADASVEEEAVVAANETPQRSVVMDKSVEELVTVMESIFSCSLPVLSVDEEEVMAAEEMQHSSATVNISAEEVATVDNLLQATVTDMSVDEEEVMAADDMQHSSATMNISAEEVGSATVNISAEEVATVDNLWQATVTDDEWAVNESALTADSTPVVDTARDFSDHTSSPMSANVFEDATKYLSIESTVKPMESEADDVPLWIFSNSGGEKNVTEPMSVQQEKEVKLGNQIKAFGSLSVRKLKTKLKEKVDGVPLCIFSDHADEKNASEPMAVEQETESEALGSLSLRKLRTEFNQIVAVAQENEVMEGEKSSVPLDKLSLRKLRLKLKETLNSQKNREPNRVPLGKLDENVC